MTHTTILLAGATGDLGARIANALVRRGATVRALIRRGTAPDTRERLERLGATLVEADYNNAGELTRACSGAACVVSALSGLREVIVDTQTRLLDAAVKAGVPRFIPSDYSIDFTRLPPGTNRNLDLRREFRQRLDQAPIQATSILISGEGKLEPLDNARYPELHWTTARDVLSARGASSSKA